MNFLTKNVAGKDLFIVRNFLTGGAPDFFREPQAQCHENALYGKKDEQKQYPREMLHAASIEFTLPRGESITLDSPLPDSFILKK